jgi:hypothetical protein
VHDGTKHLEIDATSCPPYLNNIMTPSTGTFDNTNALYYFSKCSIEAFKKTLLTSDHQYKI